MHIMTITLLLKASYFVHMVRASSRYHLRHHRPRLDADERAAEQLGVRINSARTARHAAHLFESGHRCQVG